MQQLPAAALMLLNNKCSSATKQRITMTNVAPIVSYECAKIQHSIESIDTVATFLSDTCLNYMMMLIAIVPAAGSPTAANQHIHPLIGGHTVGPTFMMMRTQKSHSMKNT